MTWALPTPDPTKPPQEWPDLLVMAATILGEAEGEETIGKRAVGCVVMNRVSDDRWPDRPTDVCLERKQFSCWNVGSPRLPAMFNPTGHVSEEIWTQCFRAAFDAWTRTEPDPTNGANSYLAPGSLGRLPIWATADKVVAKLGAHQFYRL